MKILLVGEYSRLHNSLKEGLQANGHEVCLIASGDGFKQFPADIPLKTYFQKGLAKKIKVAWHKLFGIDLASIMMRSQFMAHKNKLKGFDVVQLINESPLGIQTKYEREIIEFLKENNKKLFLLSCGSDHVSVSYAKSGKLRYSILTPFFEGKMSDLQAGAILKYLKPEYEGLHHFVYKQIDGVIASDLDYHLPLEKNPKYKGLIPNPINVEKLNYSALELGKKIVIFHGINRPNYFKKGSDYFEKALAKVAITHGEKIEIIRAESLPYKEYIEAYNRAHIVLDQVYSYDQGFNALEAMAKGKVVFTGAAPEFLKHYGLEDGQVAINAMPDDNYLKEELIRLIDSPEDILRISKAARAFVLEHHDHKKSAATYASVWTS